MKILDEFICEIKKFGITQCALMSGVSRHTISGWCLGKYTPMLSKAEKVASAMGLEFLLFEKE